MHVPDGFLSPAITVPAWAAAVPLWAVAARRHFGARAADALPVMGTLTAVAFVLQTLRIPVPGGTSTHVVGAALLALLFHPLAAFVCEGLVLAVQALFFGAGGVTTLAVNGLAMGLLGPGAAWLAFRAARRLRVADGPAAFVAAWLATQVASLSVALALALQHALDPSVFPVAPAVVLGATMLPSLALTGVVEGAYTVAALALLRKARLDARA
ncbi:MAG TPA: energy-coupling factor ABC transporter permease [Anaeromyxobacter sp.]